MMTESSYHERYEIGDVIIAMAGILWLSGFMVSVLFGWPISSELVSQSHALQITSKQLQYLDRVGIGIYTILCLLLLLYQGNRVLWLSYRGVLLWLTLATFMMANFFLDLFVVDVSLMDGAQSSLMASFKSMQSNREWIFVLLALGLHVLLLLLISWNLYVILKRDVAVLSVDVESQPSSESANHAPANQSAGAVATTENEGARSRFGTAWFMATAQALKHASQRLKIQVKNIMTSLFQQGRHLLQSLAKLAGDMTSAPSKKALEAQSPEQELAQHDVKDNSDRS